MRENQVGVDPALEQLEALLECRARERKEAVAKVGHLDLQVGDSTHQPGGAGAGLARAAGVAAEHDPMNVHAPSLGYEAKERSAAADLDVVSVRAEAEHREGTTRPDAERERQHVGYFRPFSHGGPPRAYNSSSCCLSLKVSIAFQNPSYSYDISCRSAISRENGPSTRSSPSRR